MAVYHIYTFNTGNPKHIKLCNKWKTHVCTFDLANLIEMGHSFLHLYSLYATLFHFKWQRGRCKKRQLDIWQRGTKTERTSPTWLQTLLVTKHYISGQKKIQQSMTQFAQLWRLKVIAFTGEKSSWCEFARRWPRRLDAMKQRARLCRLN